ncbi:MAG: EAL domain-containing protein [Rhodoferax sp.]|nr:EAL domain-containing protein [Rhodoferax sp.]
MPEMPPAPSALEASERALRSRRLVQISTLTIAGLAVIALRALVTGNWSDAAIVGAGITTMLLCQSMNRRGATESANLLLVMALTAMVSLLMWNGEGLRDSALLAFPAVLISAGLLTQPGRVVQLLLAMLVVIALLLLGTLEGWRSDTPPQALPSRALDTVIILLVSGFALWVMVGDLHRALDRLNVQIGQYEESQKNLTYLSHHDALTQLPNRLLGRTRIEQAMAHARRNGSQVALLFVDLDNFKAVNDSLGHTAGDDFLGQVAQRLRETVRQTDVVARQGGDEFLIGITDIRQSDMTTTVAQKVLARMAELFVVRGTEISGSCSIGIALFPDDGDDFETLLRNADISVYHAKDAGRNVFRFYDPSMNTRMQENLQLVAGLRTALAQQAFVLHYQPVVDLATGRLVAAEALLRWRGADGRLVPPGDFIPAAEKSGLIVDIGEWVLREACRQMVAWRAAGFAPFVIAVNLSPVQFRRGTMETVIRGALDASGLPAAQLELEVTESTLIQDSEKFIIALKGLKSLGIRISIDDFGTGYSNLSYLQRFSIDKLKIDQSFVRRLQDGPQERAIVSAIIQIARSLHLVTTAEGIEDEAVRQELLALGCAQGQGYLFSRPLDAQAFTAQVLVPGTVLPAPTAPPPPPAPPSA